MKTQEQIRVSFFTHWLSKRGGGVTEAVRELSHTLNTQKLASVRVDGLWDASYEHENDMWQTIHVTPHRVLGPLEFGFSPTMAKASKRDIRADLVHVHGLWKYPSRIVQKMVRRTKVPLIVSPHGMLDKWALTQSKLKKRLISIAYERANLRQANVIHALCEAEYHSIRKFGLRNPVTIIPNGVKCPVVHDCRELKQERSLIFLGRLHPKKGIESLLRGFAKSLDQATTNWKLKIAGWGDEDYVNQLRGIVSQLGIESQVIFVGAVSGAAKDELLRSADAFALTSFSEGLPIAVLEAWAYAVPVIMTPECNLPIGFEKEAAIRCEASPESVANSLVTLMNMQESELRAMGKRGRSLVESSYTWSCVASQLLDLYYWCLGAGERPPSVIVE